MKNYRIAVLGSTGVVGREMIRLIEAGGIPAELVPLGSARSAGSTIEFHGEPVTVREATGNSFFGADFVLGAAKNAVARLFAPAIAESGAVFIDNSSAFRLMDDVPLVVPEINGADAFSHHGIIANPNCSTIQAVVALKPLHDKYGIKRIVYSTYQAVSGAGVAGYEDLKNGINGEAPKKFPYPIFSNCLPHIDVFGDDGYTKEEKKMINETRKILHDDTLRITATTVRVPVFDCHSESINVELKKPFELDNVRKELADFEGIVVQDDPKNNVYPMAVTAKGTNEVYVGRLRRDDSADNALNMWVVADNIRKGAAANAVQIALKLISMWESGEIKK